MTKIYRAVVRGHFGDLDDETRAALISEAPDHDYFHSAFTADGTFTYDERLVAFNLRYELRFGPNDAGGTDTETTDESVAQHALDRATAWLGRAGYGHKHLTVSVTDMASMWR